MIASVGSSMVGSGTVSTRTSWVSCQARALMAPRFSAARRAKHVQASSRASWGGAATARGRTPRWRRGGGRSGRGCVPPGRGGGRAVVDRRRAVVGAGRVHVAHRRARAVGLRGRPPLERGGRATLLGPV